MICKQQQKYYTLTLRQKTFFTFKIIKILIKSAAKRSVSMKKKSVLLVIFSVHPLLLSSLIKQNVNPVAFFSIRERFRIANTLLKVKLQTVTKGRFPVRLSLGISWVVVLSSSWVVRSERLCREASLLEIAKHLMIRKELLQVVSSSFEKIRESQQKRLNWFLFQ